MVSEFKERKTFAKAAKAASAEAKKTKKDGITSVFIGDDDADCRDSRSRRLWPATTEKGEKHPRYEAAEEVVKSRRTKEREYEDFIDSDHNGSSDSDGGNDEWVMGI